MKLATIGVGNAGSKIIDQMLDFEQESNRDIYRHAMVINTARTDLAKPNNVSEKRRFLIGDTHPKAKGHGTGGAVEVGAKVARAATDQIHRAFDDIEIHEVDAILVAAGLGGGTGSGAGPVVIEELQKMYEEPVYGLGALPGAYEGGRAALNAGRSIQSFVKCVDNFIAFDNDAWRARGQTLEKGYKEMNQELATRLVTLLGAGEHIDSTVAENAIDSSDIIRTLDTGGISTIGFASTEVDAHSNGGSDATRIKGLMRRAVHSRLTLPAEVSSADRALFVVSGPSSTVSRKGVEKARHWLEKEADTVEVLAGDDPREESTTLSIVVVLSNVTETPRINEIQEKAVDSQQKIQEQESRREEEIEELITDEENRLDPIT